MWLKFWNLVKIEKLWKWVKKLKLGWNCEVLWFGMVYYGLLRSAATVGILPGQLKTANWWGRAFQVSPPRNVFFNPWKPVLLLNLSIASTLELIPWESATSAAKQDWSQPNSTSNLLDQKYMYNTPSINFHVKEKKSNVGISTGQNMWLVRHSENASRCMWILITLPCVQKNWVAHKILRRPLVGCFLHHVNFLQGLFQTFCYSSEGPFKESIGFVLHGRAFHKICKLIVGHILSQQSPKTQVCGLILNSS